MREFLTKSAEETRRLAHEFMQDFEGNIVELVGDLGAGKTTFMGGVGEFFGIKETLVSPTFMIQRNYEIPAGFPWKRLIHIDAYRIESEKELEAIKFKDYASDKENIIFIEWPINLKTDLSDAIRIEFFHDFGGETSKSSERKIIFK